MEPQDFLRDNVNFAILYFQRNAQKNPTKFLSEDKIHCHQKKFVVIRGNFLLEVEILCQRKKIVSEEEFFVRGKKFLSEEEILCHRKKIKLGKMFLVSGRNFP